MIITGIDDVAMINLGSDEIYDRLQKEWFSTDNNSEIHQIAAIALSQMSKRIGLRKFSRDKKLDWENLANDAALHVYSRGMNDFVTNPAVKEMTPGLRFARLNTMLANAMFSTLRAEQRRTTRKVAIIDETPDQFINEWTQVQAPDQPSTIKRKSGTIKNPTYIRETATSTDALNEEGSTILDMLTDGSAGWLDEEIEKINMNEKSANVHKALLAFFSQETTGLDKLLVVGCCWVRKAVCGEFSRKDFNEWLAKKLNGHTRNSAFQYLKKNLSKLEISTAVLKPLRSRLLEVEADGRPALEHTLNIVTGNITKWGSDMRGRMERWNDNNDKVFYLRSKSKEDKQDEK